MKSFFQSALSAVITVCLCTNLIAQEAAPEPTAQHKLLAREAGEWTGEMKMYMEGPEADPVTMPVIEKNVMMDTGLWLISDFESGPFKGHGQFGYDTGKKKFVGTWIDNQTTSLGIMEGTHDAKSGEMTFMSSMMNPATGKMEPTKTVSRFIDSDNRHFVMFMKAETGDGWSKWMEINYQRKK